MLVHDVNKVVA